MLESEIERKVGEHAKRRGWLVRKWSSPGQKGVPDRLYFRSGAVLLIEFKAPGKRPTELQKREHDRLQAQGFPVHVIDNVEDGKALVDANTV